MLIVQVRTPKIKMATHRAQNSQPTMINYGNLNSFNEFFQNQSRSLQKGEGTNESRCKTESTQIELKANHAHKISSQSTTISLTNSTSYNQRLSKQNQKSNSSNKIIEKILPKSVNPFQEDECTVNQKLQSQLKKLLIKTKDIINSYEITQKKQQITEQQLKQEIVNLKKIIENQQKQLKKHNIQY
ncbi:unnamed protein product [Paramecium pentaurelia]|uniref:Uncharacterized protein n=1 Tax=Paramecium pentaurelia TaxID=43138 RepID=A0A8S1TVC0_9CILI|nr:unnamed protein product [Paramecium pentaurelia]